MRWLLAISSLELPLPSFLPWQKAGELVIGGMFAGWFGTGCQCASGRRRLEAANLSGRRDRLDRKPLWKRSTSDDLQLAAVARTAAGSDRRVDHASGRRAGSSSDVCRLHDAAAVKQNVLLARAAPCRHRKLRPERRRFRGDRSRGSRDRVASCRRQLRHLCRSAQRFAKEAARHMPTWDHRLRARLESRRSERDGAVTGLALSQIGAPR